jgi:hypothetical protein
MPSVPSTFFPNYLIALLPGLYAWQIHGLWIGAIVWVAAVIVLAVAGWIFILNDFSFKLLRVVRIAVIIVFLILVGLSGAQTCSGTNCVSVI